jgi:hypothetical protein
MTMWWMCLLDSAAMGVNVVEREGISFSHPARFILVGTMNPEEGDLRPAAVGPLCPVGGDPRHPGCSGAGPDHGTQPGLRG